MAWGNTRTFKGVCGNVKFEFHSLTDVKATRSLVKADFVPAISFVTSVNTSDNADTFVAQTLNWTGSCDNDQTNHLEDTSETFDPVLTGQVAFNVESGDAKEGQQCLVEYDSTDTDDLSCFKYKGTATDLFPDGNEAYKITSERVVQATAQTAGDDGTLIIIG